MKVCVLIDTIFSPLNRAFFSEAVLPSQRNESKKILDRQFLKITANGSFLLRNRFLSFLHLSEWFLINCAGNQFLLCCASLPMSQEIWSNAPFSPIETRKLVEPTWPTAQELSLGISRCNQMRTRRSSKKISPLNQALL